MGPAAQGSHVSCCPHIGRHRPLLCSLHGDLGTYGSCSLDLGPDSSLGLGLGLAQPDTLGYRAMSMLPKLGVGMLARSAESVAAVLWDLGLDLLGLHEALTAQ